MHRCEIFNQLREKTAPVSEHLLPPSHKNGVVERSVGALARRILRDAPRNPPPPSFPLDADINSRTYFTRASDIANCDGGSSSASRRRQRGCEAKRAHSIYDLSWNTVARKVRRATHSRDNAVALNATYQISRGTLVFPLYAMDIYAPHMHQPVPLRGINPTSRYRARGREQVGRREKGGYRALSSFREGRRIKRVTVFTHS